MNERRQPSGHPDVLPRNVLFFMILISSVLAQNFQQQYPGARQSWVQVPFYPTNSVYQLRQVAAPTSGIEAPGSGSPQLLLHENNVRDPSKAKVISHEESAEEYVDEDYESDLESEQDPRSPPILHDYEKHNLEKQATNHSAHLQPINKNNNKNNSTYQANQHEDPASSQYDSYYYYDDYENDTHSADDGIDHPDPSAIDEKNFQSSGVEKYNLEDSRKKDSEAITVEIKSASPKNVSTIELDSKMSKTESTSRESSSKSISSSEVSDSELLAISQPPKSYSSNISDSLKIRQKEDQVSDDYQEHLEEDYASLPKTSEESITPFTPSESSSKSILIGEAVVSVVTTKSVVNGTFSVPVTLSPLTTEQISPPPTSYSISSHSSTQTSTQKSVEDLSQVTTEDSSRILASVQTSRSISGARFLPFPVIDRVEQFDQSKEESTSKKVSPSESTESIIDKLDRVQSELSNGFLAGGFRTAGNTLQMDEPTETERPNQKKLSTIKPPGKFVPRRYSDKRISTTTLAPSTTVTTTTIKSTTLKASTSRFRFQTTLDDLEGLLPKNYPKSSLKRQFPKSATTPTPTTTNNNLIPITEATTKRITAASKSATILENIRAFLPSGYKLKNEDTVTEKSLLTEILAKSNVSVSSFLPAGYSSNSTESFKNNSSISEKNSKDKSSIPSSIQDLFAKSEVDISAFLPKGFKENKNVSDKKPLEDLFAKSLPDVSAFLPKDFKERNKNLTKETEGIDSSSNKSIKDLFTKSELDLSAFLPKDFNLNKDASVKGGEEGEEKTAISNITPATTTIKTGGIKLVFPSRPGGRKPSAKITTPQTPRGEGPAAALPKIQKGWPTRATTEFTGWPTSSTTPISIEKLLEAARTATISSLNISQFPTVSEVSSTSTTTTTTTTTPRPTTPGICEDECEVAGTIRIIDNATWVPELLDRNTREWQVLANKVEREMNFVFSKSAVFKKWFKNIRIDAFSQGSILVDYFVELNNLPEGVNTQQLKVIFHDSLRTYNNNRFNETKTKGPLKMGMFTIDPKFTDFVVIPKVMTPKLSENEERLIPQWAIAVIVIGIGGLLFIIVFGVSVLANRHSVPKLKPSVIAMYDEETTKNVIQATHAPPMQRSSDYHKADIHTMWNDPGTAWNDKSFESNSNKVLVDGSMQENRKYNMYDSWRSEWNGYYYNPSHSSSKYAGYDSSVNLSRHHHPDYDTNF